jgi:cobyrinic acid a,c-diamide synthase
VVDAGSMARSAGALALGFKVFDQDINLAGIIANNLAGAAHAQWVRESIESVGLTVLGCIPRETSLHISERHLGLHTATEKVSQTFAFITAAKKAIQENVDMEKVVKIARSAPELSISLQPQVSCLLEKRERIAVAYDQAFCFYYEDNFDLLREAGAELVFFSPLQDTCLPPDISGLYIGGGYPELYADQIDNNQFIRASIRACIQANMPVYAECGGLMTLVDFFQKEDYRKFQMVGVIPGFTRLSSKLTLGYREVMTLQTNILLGKTETARGHEFHYSEWIRTEAQNSFAYRLQSQSDLPLAEGFASGNLLASYIHLHFASNSNLAQNFVTACRNWREKHQKQVL